MMINRRQFLKAASSMLAAFSLPFANASTKREPYVKVGQAVDWIGAHPGGFIGSVVVMDIGELDAIGYKVICQAAGSKTLEIYYDIDLSCMRCDVPEDFWHSAHNRATYPNVHTYIRMKRFGETFEESIRHLNFASIRI